MMLTNKELSTLRMGDKLTCVDASLPTWWQSYVDSMTKPGTGKPEWRLEEGMTVTVWYVPHSRTYTDHLDVAVDEQAHERYIVVLLPSKLRYSTLARRFKLLERVARPIDSVLEHME